MSDRMDTSMDSPSFDLQSTYISFEERRWLSTQRHIYKLDHLVQEVADQHKTSPVLPIVFTIPACSTVIPKCLIPDNQLLYYSYATTGSINDKIDRFRLHHQQLLRVTFNDLEKNINYRIFLIIMEGMIFYSSETAKEYSSLFSHEMKKLLLSLNHYIESRSSKILDALSILSRSSLPYYSTTPSNNSGLLFQLLPKIRYVNYVISPEELRYIDYSMHMKYKRHTQPTLPSTRTTLPTTNLPPGQFLTFGPQGFNPGTIPNLHSLPINYPYDDNSLYSQKYPSFWTGNHHTNENSKALFHSTSIEKNTPEYLFVQRSFNKTVSDSEINIAFIERIQNSHLWEKFSAHRTYMRRKNGIENLNERWLFHGTKSDNFHQIMSHGFNRSLCTDSVLYGRGVYFSAHASYSCLYSDKDELSSLFLCRVLVGHHVHGSNDIRVPPKITLADGKQLQADSTTDHKNPYSIVCTYHDDQNYPEYVITYINPGKRN